MNGRHGWTVVAVDAAVVLAAGSAGAGRELPGAARDIGLGANGAVWVIRTDAQSGGFGMHQWNGAGWARIEVGGVRMSVDQSSGPWVVHTSNQIFAPQRCGARAGATRAVEPTAKRGPRCVPVRVPRGRRRGPGARAGAGTVPSGRGVSAQSWPRIRTTRRPPPRRAGRSSP